MKNTKNMEFSVTYTTMDKYVNQDASDAFIPSLVGVSRTLSNVNVVYDVKNSKIVNLLNSTVDFVDASSCSDFAVGGTTSNTGVPLTVKYLKHEDSFCLNEMEQYWFGKYMKGSNSNELPFEQVFMDEKIGKLAKKIDTIIWQGGNGNDGLLTQAASASAVGVTGSSFAVSTAVGNGIVYTLDRMIDGLASDDLEQEKAIFISPANFNKYVRSLRNLNLYHFDPADIEIGMIKMFGNSNTTIISTIGMPDNKAFLHNLEYILVGTDVNPDEEPVAGQYDFVKDKYLIRYKVKIGTALAFPTKAVLATA